MTQVSTAPFLAVGWSGQGRSIEQLQVFFTDSVDGVFYGEVAVG
ncbi:hypothetical protein [Vacuolonema iberomarrocanum]